MKFDFDRVWAVGRDSYIRFYPNPGFGLCIGSWRVALSWHRGLETFRKQADRWQVRSRHFNRKLGKV